MTYTTVYVSTLEHAMSTAEIDELLAVSRRNNAERGISGLLMIRGRSVMQLLEGDESVVRALFDRIAEDPRHDGVVTVWASTYAARRFPDWSMGFDDLDVGGRRPDAAASWPEPDIAVLIPEISALGGPETEDYVHRRSGALRRALASGDRLTASLAIILHGHRPEAVLEGDIVARFRCAECRAFESPDLDHYPCSTARNAIWALEAA